MTRIVPALFALALLSGCARSDAPPALQTPADSLALEVIDAYGGWDAWAQLPLLRFDWVVERDTVEVRRVRHLWDRAGDRARIEWEIGADSVAVAVLDLRMSRPDAPAGEVWVNGVASPPEDSLLIAAYARYINDTYWLAAPVKVLDPGVNRALAPDSAIGDLRALALSFGEVGLTPGDRYWLFVRPDGLVDRWTYVLEGDTTATTWRWSETTALLGDRPPVSISTRKSKPDGTAILTEPQALPTQDPWTTPTPIL